MSVNRIAVYNAFDSEREYQMEKSQKLLSVGEEILIAQEYLKKAKTSWLIDYNYPEELALEELRKVGAVIVRCLENHGVKNRI